MIFFEGFELLQSSSCSLSCPLPSEASYRVIAAVSAMERVLREDADAILANADTTKRDEGKTMAEECQANVGTVVVTRETKVDSGFCVVLGRVDCIKSGTTLYCSQAKALLFQI